MNQMPENRGPAAGGAIMAFTILLGAAIGVAFRQPSIGILAGFGIGLVAAILVWLRDRES